MSFLRLVRELEGMGFASEDAIRIANGHPLGIKYCNVTMNAAKLDNWPGTLEGSFPILSVPDELGAGTTSSMLTLTSGPLNPAAGNPVLTLPYFATAAPVIVSNIKIAIQNQANTVQWYSYMTSNLTINGDYQMKSTDGNFAANAQVVGTDLALSGSPSAIHSTAGGNYWATVIIETVKPAA